MFEHLQILRFVQEGLIWVLTWLEHLPCSGWIHLGHLLRHLVGGCGEKGVSSIIESATLASKSWEESEKCFGEGAYHYHFQG